MRRKDPPREGVRGAKVPGRPGFLADAMVADLARWLRILGEDCLWVPPEWTDDGVLRVAKDDHRVLLTRDDRLVERAGKEGVRGVRVPQAAAHEVLCAVYREASLMPEDRLSATRCARCNGSLLVVDGQEARRRAHAMGRQGPVDEVLERHDPLWSCSVCAQAYWRGTHWTEIERVRRLVREGLTQGDGV